MAPAGPRRPRDTLAAPAAPPETRPRSLPPEGRDEGGTARRGQPLHPGVPGTAPAPRRTGNRGDTAPHPSPAHIPIAVPVGCSQDCLSAEIPQIPVLSAPPQQHSHPPSQQSCPSLPVRQSQTHGWCQSFNAPLAAPSPQPLMFTPAPGSTASPSKAGGALEKTGSNLQAPRQTTALGMQQTSSPSVQPAGGQGPRAGVTAKQTGKKILLVFLRNSI